MSLQHCSVLFDCTDHRNMFDSLVFQILFRTEWLLGFCSSLDDLTNTSGYDAVDMVLSILAIFDKKLNLHQNYLSLYLNRAWRDSRTVC